MSPTLRSFGVAASLACGLAACGGDATEIVVVVDSDLSIPDQARSLRVEITDPQGDAHVVNGSLTGAGNGWPRTVGIVHEGGRLGPIVVSATAQDGAIDVVQRRASTFFQQGRVVMLRMDLLRSCGSIDCTGDQTCTAEGCSTIVVDGANLPDWEGEPRTRFTPMPTDAGPRPDVGPGVDAGPPPGDAGSCTPGTEVCNMRDDDCDRRIDEDFDLMTDEANCGSCGNLCTGGRSCCTGTCMGGGC